MTGFPASFQRNIHTPTYLYLGILTVGGAEGLPNCEYKFTG